MPCVSPHRYVAPVRTFRTPTDTAPAGSRRAIVANRVSTRLRALGGVDTGAEADGTVVGRATATGDRVVVAAGGAIERVVAWHAASSVAAASMATVRRILGHAPVRIPV